MLLKMPVEKRVDDATFLLLICTVIRWASQVAPHSSTLAWKIPWMQEPGRLQSMGSLRVGHD